MNINQLQFTSKAIEIDFVLKIGYTDDDKMIRGHRNAMFYVKL